MGKVSRLQELFLWRCLVPNPKSESAICVDLQLGGERTVAVVRI